MTDPVLTTAGILGTDGITPVYNPSERWWIWAFAEIYTGAVGHNRFVPKVKDYVIDYDTYTTYIVESLDPATLIPVLRVVVPQSSSSAFTEDDILFGVGPGTQADTYRVYLDTSVVPHILAVDARLKVGGSMSSYAKIFRGGDTSVSGKVISKLYDQNGTLLSQNIPLELCAMDGVTNHSIRTVSVCYTLEDLPNGEIVTIVIYSDVGHVVSKRQLLVENTGFIRSVNSDLKYVSHIGLETPFLSSTTDTLIEFPLNIPVVGIGLIGIVYYSDGTSLKMPVDGSKFKMLGLDQYAATVVGQRIPCVLTYALSPDEIAYGTTSNGKYITKAYTMVSTVQDGAYAVKLFCYPVWIDQVNGYKLEWFLYNLDRNIVYNVTGGVRFNANTGGFKPLGYGIDQKLSVSINLRDVMGSFRSYIHVQTVEITLLDMGGVFTTNWTVGTEPGQLPPYGIDLFATSLMVNQNLWTVKIDSGIVTQEAWLERVYYNSKPIVNLQREIKPPVPNFFAIVTATGRSEFPMDSWNSALTINHDAPFGSTLFIEFIKRTATSVLQLGVAGLTVNSAENIFNGY
jgi:hypothetical protein